MRVQCVCCLCVFECLSVFVGVRLSVIMFACPSDLCSCPRCYMCMWLLLLLLLLLMLCVLCADAVCDDVVVDAVAAATTAADVECAV